MLTDEELNVADLILEAHNAYIKLPKQHPSDMVDWTNAIHVLQREIMKRCARSCHPLVFPHKNVKAAHSN